jgi:hypothetical protein
MDGGALLDVGCYGVNTARMLFVLTIAVVHGLSGALGVLGLHYILKQGVGETLTRTTSVTQIESFRLIVLLGIEISIKHVYMLYSPRAFRVGDEHVKASRTGLLPSFSSQRMNN